MPMAIRSKKDGRNNRCVIRQINGGLKTRSILKDAALNFVPRAIHENASLRERPGVCFHRGGLQSLRRY